MAAFDAYSHALAAVVLYGLLVLILGLVSTRGRTAEARAACGKPIRDYGNQWYRSERAFANAVDNAAPFMGATIVAVLVGAAPLAVNILASVFLLARVFMAYVHIQTENQSLRSLGFAVGFFATLGMIGVALWGVF